MNLKYNNTKIIVDANPKFQGIVFDPKLSYKEHCDTIIAKIYNKMNILKILKGKMWRSPSSFLINIYKSLIRPVIEYTNFPLLSTNAQLSRLKIIENKILRLCLSSSIYTSTIEIHREANIETLKSRLIEQSSVYISKTWRNKINLPILNMITQQEQIESYNQSILLHRKTRVTCLDELKKIIKIITKYN
jgi:hypothetical protein